MVGVVKSRKDCELSVEYDAMPRTDDGFGFVEDGHLPSHKRQGKL